MDQIQFAKDVCLAQRIMGASDASINCFSFFDEKEWGNMENACIPAHQGTTDSERQIWTDVQVSFCFIFMTVLLIDNSSFMGDSIFMMYCKI